MSGSINVHPTAVVEPGAELGEGVSIGPYCIIGKHVKIGKGTVCQSHVNIAGHTAIGENCTISPFSSLGTVPQHLKYEGEPTCLEIGDNNTIREHVTMNIGTVGDCGITRVGSNGLFMIGVHVAHDCQIGDDVILANNTALAGHVKVDSHVYIGGLCAVHQFVRIGSYAMLGTMSCVVNDVIPYGMVKGERAELHGLNLVGMRRAGFSKDDIYNLRQAYKMLFVKNGTFSDRLANTKSVFSGNNKVQKLLQFIEGASSRKLLPCAKSELAEA